jgi:hypothetical protein
MTTAKNRKMPDLMAAHLEHIQEGKTGPGWSMPQEQRREIITTAAAIGCNHIDANQLALLLQVICLEIAHSPS